MGAPQASPKWAAWRAQMRRLFAVNFSREFAGRGAGGERAGLGFEALLDQFCACAVRDAAADAGERARAAATGLDARALQAAAIEEFIRKGVDAARIACPTLVISGDDDRVVPVGNSHKLHAALAPRATLSIVEGAGHMFWEEQTAAAARTIADFLRQDEQPP